MAQNEVLSVKYTINLVDISLSRQLQNLAIFIHYKRTKGQFIKI